VLLDLPFAQARVPCLSLGAADGRLDEVAGSGGQHGVGHGFAAPDIVFVGRTRTRNAGTFGSGTRSRPHYSLGCGLLSDP
jgi:hypothetical protein